MKNKLLYLIIAIIIIAGVFMGITKGFNLGLSYSASEKIEIYLNNAVDEKEIASIANEVFGNVSKRIQTVEIFSDMVAINVPSSTEEQVNKLIELINQKYNEEYTSEDVKVIKIPATSIKEIVSEYIIPTLLAVCAFAIYMAIRYWKLKPMKVLFCSLLICIVAEAIFASVYTITRLPVNELTMPLAMFLLGATILYTQIYYNKKEKKINKKSENINKEEISEK